MHNSRTALIVVANAGPALRGGGRGVAYQFLQGLSEDFPQLPDVDLYGLFDEHLEPLHSAADARRIMASPWSSRFDRMPKWLGRAPKWFVQSQIVNQLASRYRATVVLAYTHFHAAWLLRRRNDLRLIHTEHSKGGMHTEHLLLKRKRDVEFRLLHALCDGAIRRADRVVFPSHSAAKLYEQNNPGAQFRDKCSIIYNGIPDPLEGRTPAPPVSEAVTTIFNIAQHVPEKGIEMVLEGLALWRSRTSGSHPVRFVNVGEHTSETPRLRELVTRLQIEDLCEFAGWTARDRVMELLARADVFALTPQVAVFDLALLEGMALSKPILSTPVGGNVEALGEHYQGYVASPAEFAEKLDALLRDPGYAARLGAANRQRFLENFHLRSMMASYWSLLTQTVAGMRAQTA